MTVLGPPAAASDGADVHIAIVPGKAPTDDAPAGWLALAGWTGGAAYRWNLSLPDRVVAEVRVDTAAVDVDRVRQIVPTLDDAPQHPPGEGHLHPHLYNEVAGPIAQAAAAPPRAYNGTLDAANGTWVLRLTWPGPGNASFALTRDVDPPNVTADAPANVTHVAFDLVTRTDEPALGTLSVAAVDVDHDQTYPTHQAAFRQTFPVQGLRADTLYRLEGTFIDWAGNARTIDLGSVRTAPEPDLPGPVVEPLEPAPDATLDEPVALIRARAGNATLPAAGVRLFVDKAEVHGGFAFDGSTVTHRPAEPLGPGLHVVRVQATSQAGGVGAAQWRFTVATEAAPGWDAALVLGAATLAAALAARDRAMDDP